MKTKTSLLIVVSGIVIAACLFIWPTLYEYSRNKGIVYRTNRFTGVRQRSSEEGWVAPEFETHSEFEKKLQNDRDDFLKKVDKDAGLR